MAGGTMPSKHFGVNAAWWLITVLAHNLNQAMKMLALAKVYRSWAERRLKAVRFHLIHLPGRVTQHAREMVVRVSTAAARFLAQVRAQILGLIRAAPA
ncbi:MAG: hypothetical protein ACOX9B_02800 [Candidatus Xenobium sp.]